MTAPSLRRLAMQLKKIAFEPDVRNAGYDATGLVALNCPRQGINVTDWNPMAMLIEAARICETFANHIETK